jgi:hypothetical protein
LPTFLQVFYLAILLYHKNNRLSIHLKNWVRHLYVTYPKCFLVTEPLKTQSFLLFSDPSLFGLYCDKSDACDCEHHKEDAARVGDGRGRYERGTVLVVKPEAKAVKRERMAAISFWTFISTDEPTYGA